jgi:hypothetical protein
MTSSTIAPTALRDSLADTAIEAAKWRAQTDEEQAGALLLLAGLIGVACCDEAAIGMLAAAPAALQAEVRGAITDPSVIAAVCGTEVADAIKAATGEAS